MRQICTGLHGKSYRFTAGALQALHEGSEHHVIKILDSANLCAIHARRVTVMPKDIQLAGKLLELDRNYKTSEIVTGAAGTNAREVAVTEDRRGGMNSRRGGDNSNSRQTSDNHNDDDEDGGSGAGLLQEVVVKEEGTVPRVEKHMKMMMMMKM